MEPFSLFQLLSSLLPQTEQPSEKTPPAPPPQEPAPVQAKTEETPPFNSLEQNACVQFLEAHETRAKRTRK